MFNGELELANPKEQPPGGGGEEEDNFPLVLSPETEDEEEEDVLEDSQKALFERINANKTFKEKMVIKPGIYSQLLDCVYDLEIGKSSE